MEDIFYIIVAVIIIYVSYRWLFYPSSGTPNSGVTPASGVNSAATLGFRPRRITPEMVQIVATMFPDIPEDNIRYDLLRTGSTERTVNSVLEKGFLPVPPASYVRETPARPASTHAATSRPADTPLSAPKAASLISRFRLEDRIGDDGVSTTVQPPDTKAAWEATPQQRQASLTERKNQMILAARRRLVEKQTKPVTTSV